MNLIRCIVLEDEEPAQNLLRHYFKKLPELELVEVFGNALEASDFLEKNTADLIITDIEMPRLSGLDFIRMLTSKYQVIIITAYPQYAVESYDLDVVDYIKKPAHFDRFVRAIEKVKHNLEFNIVKTNNKDESSYILVKEDGKSMKVELNEVIYVEGLGDYVKIITTELAITTHTTMNKILEVLPSVTFMRVHKSFIINTNKINSIDSPNSLVIMNNKKEITLGRVFKTDFMARFKPMN